MMKLKYPRIQPAEFSIGVVGESHYQKDIREIILYEIMVEKDDMEYKDTKLDASLILEDENKFDPGNAVRVEIENKTVGYLEKRDAESYRDSLFRKDTPNAIYSCNASAFGKRTSPRGKMEFGIWININPRNIEIIQQPPPRKKLFGIF